jgi:hypothetical protein
MYQEILNDLKKKESKKTTINLSNLKFIERRSDRSQNSNESKESLPKPSNLPNPSTEKQIENNQLLIPEKKSPIDDNEEYDPLEYSKSDNNLPALNTVDTLPIENEESEENETFFKYPFEIENEEKIENEKKKEKKKEKSI